MKISRRSLALCAMLLCATVFALALHAAEANAALRRAAASTVMVYIQYGEPYEKSTSWGTGFVIGDGLVMTNAHVVSERVPTRIFLKNEYLPPTEAKVLARRYDTNEFVNANVVDYIATTLMGNAGIDGIALTKSFSNYDVALLSFTPPAGVRLPVLSFSLDAAPNQRAYAVGYPGADNPQVIVDGYGPTPPPAAPISITGGVVNQVINRDPLLLMHDAYAKSGNSGGPLVNERGEVLGMQTWSAPADNRGVVTSFALGARDLTAFAQGAGYQAAVSGSGTPRRQNPAGRDVRAYVLQNAATGNPDYVALAGLLYALGDCGFPRDPAQAAEHLARAMNAAPNSPNAYLYMAGLAAVQLRSPELRSQYRTEELLQAANARRPDHRLMAYEASLYQGRSYDPQRSMSLAERALEGGFALPMALTGYQYYFGDAPSGHDHDQAMFMAREAARNGIPEGISLLAHMYYDSDAIPHTAENVRFAKSLAVEAARLNDPWAMGLLSVMYYDSGNAQERDQARDLALHGARHGNRLALYCLGRIAWDAYLANPNDIAQAAKAWAFMDLAERRGVRITHAALRSSRDILRAFTPDIQQWVMAEGQREQQAIIS